MMNTQQSKASSSTPGGPVRLLAGGEALPLGSGGGRLDVLSGRVWLTRSGVPDDFFIEGGQTLSVLASGQAVIEAFDRDERALIAWQPRTLVERLGDAARAAFGRCFELMSPIGRLGIGSLAALAALLAGALVFGPLSDARAHALAGTQVLHNGGGAPGAAAASRADALPTAERARQRARVAAQETRRRAPGAA